MQSIAISLIFLGFILLISLVGWAIEKVCKNWSDHRDLVLFKRDVIENFHWILFYLFLFTLFKEGFQGMLGGQKYAAESFILSLLMVGFAYSNVQKQQALIKKFRLLIKLAAANDSQFLSRLSISNPSNYLETRDIPLSLIVEKQQSYISWSHPFLRNTFPGAACITLVKNELEDLLH